MPSVLADRESIRQSFTDTIKTAEHCGLTYRPRRTLSVVSSKSSQPPSSRAPTLNQTGNGAGSLGEHQVRQLAAKFSASAASQNSGLLPHSVIVSTTRCQLPHAVSHDPACPAYREIFAGYDVVASATNLPDFDVAHSKNLALIVADRYGARLPRFRHRGLAFGNLRHKITGG
jgi:hypothetical protein